MKKILLILLITTFLFLVGGQSICFASEILVLDNVATIGAPDVYVTDGGPGDINPALGVITFSGAIGQFIVNVTTGISKPVYPASDSHIQLVSIDVNSVGAGALNIYFGDTGFFSPLGGDFFGGGVSAPGSTVTLEAFFDNSNADLINGKLSESEGNHNSNRGNTQHSRPC